jgi:3D-(3,5/4)-trihydroxycyclohexane-1,2-dione acylhydrolase (decyclizing)
VVAERIPLVIVLIDNHGYASIGALSRSLGSAGFGTLFRFSDNGSVQLDPASTDALPIDLAANAETLGARVVRASTIEDLRQALAGARGAGCPVVVYIEADRYRGVPGYESSWDVPVAEVSEEETVRAAREAYEREHERQRQYLRSAHD